MVEQVNIAQWLQLGFAVAVAVYLLTKQIPRMEDRAEKRDAAFLAAIDKQHEHNAKQVDRVVETQEMIRDRLHDLANSMHSNGGGSNGAGHRGDRGSRG